MTLIKSMISGSVITPLSTEDNVLYHRIVIQHYCCIEVNRQITEYMY